MTARLHVLLGAGGVGKTTLAAGLSLALARSGRRVGLLGVDPAGRLRTALGLGPIGDAPTPVPGAEGLQAALLRPAESLRRWAAEELEDAAARERLVANPFFLALADGLAGAVDVLAALRAIEWADADPRLQDLVVDTAPGLHGMEFLARPQKLLALLEGRLLRWLAALARRRAPHRVGRRVLEGLAHLAGSRLLLDLADFSLLVEQLAATMVRRLERAGHWFRAPETELLLVCAPGPHAAADAEAFRRALRELGLGQGQVVLNKALLGAPPTPGVEAGEEERAFLRYARGLWAQQVALRGAVGPAVEVAVVGELDAGGAARMGALAGLGEQLLRRERE